MDQVRQEIKSEIIKPLLQKETSDLKEFELAQVLNYDNIF